MTSLRRVARAARALACTSLGVIAGCDATTTSLGAWEPETSSPDAALSDATPSDATLPEASTGFYLEAESGQLVGGFTIGNDATASAGAYIEPPAGMASSDAPGAARASYAFDIATSGTYLVWGRIHSPDASHNTLWLQVDGGRWFLWRLTTGDVWYWAPLHENFNYSTPLTFELDAGPHELVVANAGEGDGLDRFYFTADGDTPPGNDTPCKPPHSVQLNGVCVPSCGSQGGNQCGVTACQGRTTLPAYDCDVCCIMP